MSSFFADLEAQMRAAARAQVGAAARTAEGSARRRRPRRFLRASMRAAPILASVVVTIVVVGAAFVLVAHRGHGGTPPQGSPPPGGQLGAIVVHTPKRQLQREVAFIMAATTGRGVSNACRVRQPAGVTYIGGSPGPDLLSILGVLRRPATPGDRLHNPGGEPLAGIPDIYRAYVRRARVAGGYSYYIVPTRFDRATQFPSNRCFALQAAALKKELPKVPASLRKPTRELQAALIAYYQRMAAHAPPDSICLVYGNRNESGTSCGIGPDAIKAGLAVDSGRTAYSGVVPDGVSSVTAIFPPAGGHPARSISAPVKGNVYAVPVNNPSLQSLSPTVIWRSSDGRVIKRINPQNVAAEARDCRKNPFVCLFLPTMQTSSQSGSSHSVTAQAPQRTKP